MKNYSYKQAIDELEKIVSEIESGNPDLDELLKKMERAATLILFCKEKLKKSETTLENVIKKLEAGAPSESDSPKNTDEDNITFKDESGLSDLPF